ncbi:helix-turn-helix transcriptional regulator [Pseudarthrobacter raffinosi]|uniref:helix-turn-helix transcriptional regulator n=1 Tax=Pseudarthrobacter raffinosi TaxID=2953651 RepID=UPI00208F99C5|nr:response regulator transcription factor family protein [Pseudarthrobacter sp. MDT3-9]MCO4252159.1 LuxR C-terminal-related transcriptional regulator [Pseudarthrobacter sp. MDT3-9]
MTLPDVQGTFLQAVSALADAPLTQIAERLRDALSPYVWSSALVIFTEDCTGRPQKKAGDDVIISRVSIAELERLRASLHNDGPWQGDAEVAGTPRRVLAIKFAPSNALLVITEPNPVEADSAQGSPVALVEYLWQIAARRIQEKVADAPPSYLMESRAASTERVRVTAELVDMHSTTLETLLAALRASSLDDASARSTVSDLTARALVALRTVSDRTTDLVEEPVAMAFGRLQEDLRPLTRFSGVNVQFIEPPLNGRALPGEVAHAARAVVRGLVLAMMEQPEVRRIRAQWDCDGDNLLVNVRDDGQGALSADATTIGRLERRVQALSGNMQIDVMPGWGADVSVTLPLDAPTGPIGDVTGWNLAARELEVLQHLAAGQRNRSIALALNISENTVKFHVRNLFKKLSVSSRTEAIALAHSHGVR